MWKNTGRTCPKPSVEKDNKKEHISSSYPIAPKSVVNITQAPAIAILFIIRPKIPPFHNLVILTRRTYLFL